jgi:hypothetical protein
VILRAPYPDVTGVVIEDPGTPATGSTTSTVTLARPNGGPGSLMLAVLAYDSTTAPTSVPSGWTLVSHVINPSPNAQSLLAYYRVRQAGDPSDWTWTISGGTSLKFVGVISSRKGINPTAPIMAYAPGTFVTTASAPLAALTTWDTTALVAVASTHQVTTFTPPNGFTERTDSNNVSGFSLTVADLQNAPASARSGLAFTAGQAISGCTLVIGVTAAAQANVSAHRYWRLLIDAGGSSAQAGELEFRATVTGADETLNAGGAAIRSAEFNSSFAASKAFDNNVGTWWFTSLSAGSTYLGWDFGAGNAVAVREYAIHPGNNQSNINAGSIPTAWRLQYSDDASSWTTVDTRSGVTGWVVTGHKAFQVPGP